MKPALGATAATLLLTSAAICQTLVPIPPHATTYNGYSRGYNFTSATNFIIQSLDLPTDAFQAGDTASYLVRVNGVQAFFSVGGAGAVTVTPTLLVNSGDIVDVIGNWSPAVTNNFSAHNSYGSTAPYATTIEGVPHTLNRTGVQWDIGDPGYTGGLFLTPGAGSIGRVEMYTTPQAGLFASFTSDVQTGPSPLTVNFQDTSFSSDPGGVVGWAWDFENDGTVDSTLQNPSHTYTACGSYDVALQVFDASHPPSTTTQLAFINTDTVDADFTHSVIGPLVVQFTDTSSGPAQTWDWDLDGDGTTDSTAQNPAWAYTSPNPVAITLTVTRLCSAPSTITKTIVPVTCIETLYAGGNGGGAGWTMYMDCDVTNPQGIEITSLDANLNASTNPTETIDVYIGSDTYLGNEMNASHWQFVGTATGPSNGPGVPSPMTLSNSIYLAPGDYAIALHYSGGMPFTNGSGANQMYSNGDLTLNLGISRSTTFGAPFGAGGTFNPRVWNGGFCYEIYSINGGAGYGFAGSGCPGSLGSSELSASAEPVLGTTITVDVTNMPDIGGGVSAGVLVSGFSNTISPLGPLPLDLTQFGAPGCSLRVSPDVTTFLAGINNTATWTLTIPNDPALGSTLYYQQAVVIDPGFNAAGAVGSHAGGLLIGN